jgi:hypothetical protein
MATVALLLVTSVLTGIAVVQLIAPSFVERTCLRRRCPRGFLQSVAIVELIAATFLIVPETRIWGIAATAGIIMAGLVIMLYNRRLVWACAALTLLLTLIPVAIAQ